MTVSGASMTMSFFFSRLRGYNDGTARGRGDKARVVESILLEHAVSSVVSGKVVRCMIRWATMLRRTFGEYHGHALNEASVGRCIPRGGERHEPFGDSLPPSPFPRPGDTASYHRYQRRFGMDTRGEGVWGKPDGWNWRGRPGTEDRGPRGKDRGTDAPASRLV